MWRVTFVVVTRPTIGAGPRGGAVVVEVEELGGRLGRHGTRLARVVPGQAKEMDSIELHSPAFNDHAPIPPRFAKDGENTSPPLEWSGVPPAAELVMLCEDPDAPGRTFVHWVLAGLEPSRTGLAEGEVPQGAVEGSNDYGETGYGGPQPPVGDRAHRYFFSLHAVAEPLGISPGASAADVRQAMDGKEVGRAVLVGTYQR